MVVSQFSMRRLLCVVAARIAAVVVGVVWVRVRTLTGADCRVASLETTKRLADLFTRQLKT